MKYKVYIGWDSREKERIAYDVARHSIYAHAANPKNIHVQPLQLEHLPMLTRPIERREDGKLWCPISEAPVATEFAISRFCVPLLQKDGWALFVDCDVLFQADVAELFALADDRYAVMVVKHAQEGGVGTKMDGVTQLYYNRKNWSSVVLWNCNDPYTRGFVEDEDDPLNTWTGRDLHAFKWLPDEKIGELPHEWNQLVGIDRPMNEAKLLHYTLGIPLFEGYENCDNSSEWWAAYKAVHGVTE